MGCWLLFFYEFRFTVCAQGWWCRYRLPHDSSIHTKPPRKVKESVKGRRARVSAAAWGLLSSATRTTARGRTWLTTPKSFNHETSPKLGNNHPKKNTLRCPENLLTAQQAHEP